MRGTRTFEHQDFPGLSLEIKFTAIFSFGSTRFKGRMWTPEARQEYEEKLEREARLRPAIQEAAQAVKAHLDAGALCG